MAIKYFSTNKDLSTDSIRGFKKSVSFREALFMGQAPDKGLFMSSTIPKLSKEEIISLRGKPYHEVAYEILKRFLSDDIEDQTLRDITKDAYNFDIPIEKLGNSIHIVRLDQGPTASFKDFAARFVAFAMKALKKTDEKITVLTATSGDTGGAIGNAFHGFSDFNVYILYPRDEVSTIQKNQLDSIGDNIRAIAIDGKFDDCQRLVKEAFSDPTLRNLKLTSANSINIGRILPQICYYFYIYTRVMKKFEPVLFSVPSGNLGNALGCEIARRMGLPVKTLIIATNENDEFPKFLSTGKYRKIVPSRKCLSNAMNVGNPSNLARLFDLYGGTLDREGNVHRVPDIKQMKETIYSVSITDQETRQTIQKTYKKYGSILEPHGAVAVAALQKFSVTDSITPAISIETAHPAKFPEVLKKIIDAKIEIPDALENAHAKKGSCDHLSKEYNDFRQYLLRRSEK